MSSLICMFRLASLLSKCWINASHVIVGLPSQNLSSFYHWFKDSQVCMSVMFVNKLVALKSCFLISGLREGPRLGASTKKGVWKLKLQILIQNHNYFSVILMLSCHEHLLVTCNWDDISSMVSGLPSKSRVVIANTALYLRNK